MEKITNLIDYHPLENFEDENSDFHKYMDDLKHDIVKGAWFIRKKDGRYAFGCTEESKLGQERMLYQLKKTVEFYIEKSPDFDEMKETAELLGKTEEEVLRDHYDLDSIDDDEEYEDV
jgi:hypothetical protein